MTGGEVRAVVFDFDGTIIDTETPVYLSWKHAFETAGVEPISLKLWRAQIGLADADALDTRAVLCERLGVAEVPDEIEQARRARVGELVEAEPVRAGVLTWIEAAEAAGLALAVASSSPTRWVDGHLVRLGLRDRFAALSCADAGIPGKPDPTVYLRACEAVAVAGEQAIAIEDSSPGVAGALAAGLRCLAVPGPMTVGGDFAAATAVADSLADLNPASWLHP